MGSPFGRGPGGESLRTLEFDVICRRAAASVERAVAAFPDTDGIFEKNIETLRRLGHEGWRRLMGPGKK